MLATKEVIENVRQRFLRVHAKNPELYHENDVKNIRENDWPVERFVSVNSSEGDALKAIVKAMQWRKSFGVHNFNDQYFPRELFQINAVFQCGRDKEDRPVLWIVTRNLYKCAELGTYWRQFFVYQFEKLDRQTSHQGWAYIADATDSGLSNVDMDFNNFMVDVIQSYYPRGLKYMVSVDLPWILNSVSKLVLAFMNDELKRIVKFIKKEELNNYLNADAIPAHLGGGNANFKSEIPAEVRKLDQMEFTTKQIEKIYSTFKCLKVKE